MSTGSQEKQERLLEAVAALLAATPTQSLKITVLNKALFYLDLFALLERGRAVTMNTYIALEQGPVIAEYGKRLVAAGEKTGLLKQEPGAENSKPVKLLKPPITYRYLDAGDSRLVQHVADFVKDKTATGMSNLAHDNPGWIIAWRQGGAAGKNAPKRPINMRIALQQITENDNEWVRSPLTLVEMKRLAAQRRSDEAEW